VVRFDPEGWRLTGSGRAHLLDRETPDFQGDSLLHWIHNLRRWTEELPAAVRGEPVAGRGSPASGAIEPEALPRFMAAMDNKPQDLVDGVVRAVRRLAPGAETLLDLGGGPGRFARAFAGSGFRVTLFDRPEVVEYVAAAYGLESHPSIELRTGDFLVELPDARFDVVLAANITHIHSPDVSADLIRRAAACVRAGGILAVLDFVRGRSDFAALFAITMLLNTEEGGTYTAAEYEEWLRRAGLAQVRFVPVDADVHLIVGRRPAESR
jgi:2-polyprenyl-3-methyl-5-hydroxy-6-metoxy-1,4-benzoquinol methylase